MLEGALHIKQTNIRRLNKLDKLELAHRSCRLIKLSNNPSGKKTTPLATSSLLKHWPFKLILFNNWFILISYQLFFLNSTYWFFFFITWLEKVLTHKKGVLELAKEQKFYIDSHIILIILGQECFEYLLKTPLQSIIHFSYIEKRFVLFNRKRGYSWSKFFPEILAELLQSNTRHFFFNILVEIADDVISTVPSFHEVSFRHLTRNG